MRNKTITAITAILILDAIAMLSHRFLKSSIVVLDFPPARQRAEMGGVGWYNRLIKPAHAFGEINISDIY